MIIPYTNYNTNLPEWLIIFFHTIHTRIFPIFLMLYEYSKTNILLINNWFWNEQSENNNTILSEEQQFLENNKYKFLTYITSESTDKSSNIDSLFYKKSEFIEYMKSQNTDLEQIWKTRILIVNTPRGNITMYYDPYKLGFAYYSDQNVISYDILNTVAMKYVITYRCTEFFIDEFILPDDTKNPLRIYFVDEKKQIQSLVDIHPNTQDKYNSPFMKPKQNNQAHNNNNNNNQSHNQDKLRNKFIYLGNMRNFSPCQKINISNRNIIQGFASVLLDGIDSGMNWLSYKQRKSKKE